jgi:HEAT repeat protein
MRCTLMILFLFLPVEVWGQQASTNPLDPLEFPRLKTFGAYRTTSNNLYVDSNDDSKHPIPGETLVLADLKGPGIVTHLWITVADNEFAWPRLLRLRVYYDGHKTPSVDTPLGDFFAVGHGYERNLNSLLIHNASFGRAHNSYWPMPFRKSCRITVTNEGQRRVSSFYYHVDWQKHDSLPEDIGYFHAYYRQADPPPSGKLYTFLNIRGEGQYVGTVLNIIQTQMGWFGEGDDMFYVDDEPTPRIEGTGTEDYFNDAWGLRVSDGTWTGTPVAEGEGFGARLTGYRWHVIDPVPFKKSLRVGIEHMGWTYNPDGAARSGFEERSDFFSSVAFWYQKGVNEDLPEPPYGAARLPLGNKLQIAVPNNLKDVTTERGEVTVQKEVFWSKDLLFLQGQGAGTRMNVPFDVPKVGFYEVIAQIAQSPDYGDYVALLDGKQTNSTMLTWGPLEAQSPPVEILHNYQAETFVSIDHRLGWFRLPAGRHILTLTCVGKDSLSTGFNLGVEGVVLEEIPNGEALVHATGAGVARYETMPAGIAAHAPATGIVYRGQALSYYLSQLKQASEEQRAEVIRSIGAFGEDAALAVPTVTAALADHDPGVRAAAAGALAQIGAKSSEAAPAVAKLLNDDNLQVRESATLALREMGKGAAGTIPGLCGALKDPAGTVRMTAALALGRMGDAATSAVPALAAALEAPDENQLTNEDVQVLRNIAYALGDIGPSARSAIPALSKVQHLRVKYIAEEAIAKIEGHPYLTWH